MKLENRRIWITGAASGIGEAMARQLSGVASLLIISDLNAERLLALKPELEKGITTVDALPFDLSNRTEVEKAADKVLATYGGVDLLINNGGISQRGLFYETTEEVDRRIMEINFFSYVVLTKKMLPPMLAQGFGHIAATSSMTGKFGFPLRSSYAASKHAVQGYFETVGLELYDRGIRVTVASPGRIRTNISVNALSGEGTRYGQMDPGQAGGMPAEKCAARYLRAIRRDQWEVYIGYNEILMIWFKRYLPWLFRKLALRVGKV
ncbi:MAG TPA: SDR family NAD(P)-dependent oxidoreductase [Bacteroidales bacterium]|nr:SDR family NAD(P)-dependent oxidoreductase [Bacteroidales bacterium]